MAALSDQVNFQPRGRYVRVSGLWRFFRYGYTPSVSERDSSWHSDTCDCPECRLLRRHNHWTPGWYRGMINAGAMPIDYKPPDSPAVGIQDWVFLKSEHIEPVGFDPHHPPPQTLGHLEWRDRAALDADTEARRRNMGRAFTERAITLPNRFSLQGADVMLARLSLGQTVVFPVADVVMSEPPPREEPPAPARKRRIRPTEK
jgi:hypothetical protein